MRPEIHITVAAVTSLNGYPNLRKELSILKSALIYADKISYCSIMANQLLRLQNDLILLLDDDTLDQLVYPDSRGDELRKSTLQAQRYYRAAQDGFNFLPPDSNVPRIPYILKVAEVAEKSGLYEAIEILEHDFCDLVDLPFDRENPDEITEAYVNTVFHAAVNRSTHLMFDNLTGSVVNEATTSGHIQPSKVSKEQAKQVSLASELLVKLPRFDDASVDEILDIREELKKPLIRFRSGIVKFSREIESASWDSDFPYEANQVFVEHVEPAILEIEEVCRSTSFLAEFIPTLAEKPAFPAVSSTLGILLASTDILPAVVTTGLGFAGGAAINSLRAYQAYMEKIQAAEANNLYFYYRAGEDLKNE